MRKRGCGLCVECVDQIKSVRVGSVRLSEVDRWKRAMNGGVVRLVVEGVLCVVEVVLRVLVVVVDYYYVWRERKMSEQELG